MIEIQTTYSKKLGLPNFSSHSFSVTVRAEISSLRRLEIESARLYRLLQTSVDKEVQEVGFLPDATKYGMLANGNAGQNGDSGNGHRTSAASVPATDASHSSEKQKTLIAKVAKEQKFTDEDLEGIAQRLFKLPLEQLDRKKTSRFITELLTIAGPPRFRSASRRPVARDVTV
jgi:hypothetical protein